MLAVPAGRHWRRRGSAASAASRSLVVITSGLTAAAVGRPARHHAGTTGMRLVGPNCFGVAVPGIGLDATFAAQPPASPGTAGLAVQSGGVGVALLKHFSRLGIGISSFASVGDKLDVSGNDMLHVVGAGRPHQAGRAVPGVVRQPAQVRPDARAGSAPACRCSPCTRGRSAPGQRAAASHTAAAAAPLITRQALFEQAGDHRHHQPRRTARRGRAAGRPAGPGRQPGSDRVQRRRGRRAGRRRLRARRA